MIELWAANRRSLRKLRSASPQWVFLGKSIETRSACEAELGIATRLDVTEAFHRISRDLRQPFVEFVAEVGARQQDQLGWFSSSFAWKDPDVSALFLLICYLKLVGFLAAEQRADGRLVVLVEDRWLYVQCRNSLSGAPIQFCSSVFLGLTKLGLFTGAIAARAVWLMTMLREFVRHARYAKRYRVRPHHACWLYSLPHARCFAPDHGWKDPFLGNLDEVLTAQAKSVGRLIPSDPVGFAAELAERSNYVYPMILEVSAVRVLKSLFARWRPSWKDLPSIENLDVSVLAKRDWWTDLRHPLWAHHRLFYECALSAMRKYRPQIVIFPYENQPWEKMLVCAGRETGVGSIGYQHSTVPKFLLAYFLGKHEAETAPLPDLIMTTGKQQMRLLADGGTPPARVRLAGSLRYGDLRGRIEATSKHEANGHTRVLVAISHDPYLSSALLDALERAFPDHGKHEALSFYYRPHPTFPLFHAAISWMEVVKGDLTPQLSSFDVAVTTGTTVALEAIFLGIPVVKFRADVLLDLDPLDALPESAFRTASASQLKNAIAEAASEGRRDMVSPVLIDELFPPVREEEWLSAFSEVTARAGGAQGVFIGTP